MSAAPENHGLSTLKGTLPVGSSGVISTSLISIFSRIVDEPSSAATL